MSEVNEIWKPVVGYEGLYEVSDAGRIRRIAAGRGTHVGRILKPSVLNGGYLGVGFSKSPPVRIHRLVAQAFIGNPPAPHYQVNHKNRVRADNRLENLEWVTAKENVRHSMEGPDRDMSRRIARSKPRLKRRTISDETIALVKKQLSEGRTMASIAREFGIGETSVQRIRDNILRKEWVRETEG